jgi:hypothetical protein
MWKGGHLGNEDGYRIEAKFVRASPEDMDRVKNLLNILKNLSSSSSKILSKFVSIFPGFSSPAHREMLNRKVQR